MLRRIRSSTRVYFRKVKMLVRKIWFRRHGQLPSTRKESRATVIHVDADCVSALRRGMPIYFKEKSISSLQLRRVVGRFAQSIRCNVTVGFRLINRCEAGMCTCNPHRIIQITDSFDDM